MITCSIVVHDPRIVAANIADYPIKTKRFSITTQNNTIMINAEDHTAFKAAINAVYNALATFSAMQTIP